MTAPDGRPQLAHPDRLLPADPTERAIARRLDTARLAVVVKP